MDTITISNDSTPKWSRKLYLKQPFPDNHVDSSTFLRQLQLNLNVPIHTLSQMISDSFPIVQHLTSILFFIGCFLLILDSRLSLNSLLNLANGTTIIAYSGWVLYARNQISLEFSKDREMVLRKKGRETIIHGLIFSLLLMIFSPILKTLTEDTSSDTIWAISTILFLLCWMTHDYSSSDPIAKSAHTRYDSLVKNYSSPFSLNCAMLGSIALASRLPTVTHVFGFLSLAVNIFAFFPILRRIIKKLFGSPGETFLSFSSIFVTFLLWWNVFVPVAFIFIASILFINFLCPLWLLRLQKYKKYD